MNSRARAFNIEYRGTSMDTITTTLKRQWFAEIVDRKRKK